jgi:hypothetical protein
MLGADLGKLLCLFDCGGIDEIKGVFGLAFTL